jgi:hypothetical protein
VGVRDKIARSKEDEEILVAASTNSQPEEAKGEKTSTAAASSSALQDSPKDEEAVVDELLKRILGAFARRMLGLLDLGVLALTHAEILEDIAKVHSLTGVEAMDDLKAARRRINQDMGDDEYSTMIDIDVRETFHKMLIVNNFNTYGGYKPLPGVLQVDFKEALTEVSAETILSAAHLFQQAFPGHMTLTLQRALSRAFLRKFSAEGEEVMTEDRRELVLRPAKPLLFSKEALPRFANLLAATPLRKVKGSAEVWEVVLEKAERLALPKVVRMANEHLAEAAARKQKAEAAV